MPKISPRESHIKSGIICVRGFLAAREQILGSLRSGLACGLWLGFWLLCPRFLAWLLAWLVASLSSLLPWLLASHVASLVASHVASLLASLPPQPPITLCVALGCLRQDVLVDDVLRPDVLGEIFSPRRTW